MIHFLKQSLFRQDLLQIYPFLNLLITQHIVQVFFTNVGLNISREQRQGALQLPGEADLQPDIPEQEEGNCDGRGQQEDILGFGVV